MHFSQSAAASEDGNASRRTIYKVVASRCVASVPRISDRSYAEFFSEVHRVSRKFVVRDSEVTAARKIDPRDESACANLFR